MACRTVPIRPMWDWEQIASEGIPRGIPKGYIADGKGIGLAQIRRSCGLHPPSRSGIDRRRLGGRSYRHLLHRPCQRASKPSRRGVVGFLRAGSNGTLSSPSLGRGICGFYPKLQPWSFAVGSQGLAWATDHPARKRLACEHHRLLERFDPSQAPDRGSPSSALATGQRNTRTHLPTLFRTPRRRTADGKTT